MEILKLIDLLEDKVEQSKTIPLLNRALIDREELLAAIEEIRLNIPEDMKQARLIKDERKRILIMSILIPKDRYLPLHTFPIGRV